MLGSNIVSTKEGTMIRFASSHVLRTTILTLTVLCLAQLIQFLGSSLIGTNVHQTPMESFLPEAISATKYVSTDYSESTFATVPFPRWGENDEGIEFDSLMNITLEVIWNDKRMKQSHQFAEIVYVVDKQTVWTSETTRKKTLPTFIRGRGKPTEHIMMNAWKLLVSNPSAASNWPILHRSVQEHDGFPFLVFLGDFPEGCNQHNYRYDGTEPKVLSVPVFSTCAHINCSFAFPMPNYKLDSFAKNSEQEWESIFAQYATRYTEKKPSVVWRGSLTGDLKNFTNESPRWRIGRFLTDNDSNELIDFGITAIPEYHQRENLNLSAIGGLRKSISPMEDFQKYKAILDIDGTAWSSRFAGLLCYSSVVLKVEPDYVEYFSLKYLKPWTHFVPVKSDLSDLLEKAAYVMDPTNADEVQEIIRNANHWCKTHLTHDALARDMLDVWEAYVSKLLVGDGAWFEKWSAMKPLVFRERSKMRPLKV